jgi:hypothetical protein
MACYFVTVPVRHVVLAVLGAAVLLAGVYLFYEVRSTPAALAEGRTTVEPARTHSARTSPPDEPPPLRAPGHAEGPIRPTPTRAPTNAGEAPSVPESSDDDDTNQRANPTLDAIMDRANKAYDHSDFEEAKSIAGKVLAKQPNNVRMMRIMVSASCIDGDVAVAERYFDLLPRPDREQMRIRCDKYGVTFKEQAQ